MEDFACRIGESLHKRQIESLAASGAFDCLERDRARVFHGAEMLTRFASRWAGSATQNLLFRPEENPNVLFSLPHLEQEQRWSPTRILEQEAEFLGFYLSSHPLDKHLPILRAHRVREARTLHTQTSASVCLAGILLGSRPMTDRNGRPIVILRFSDSSSSFEAFLFADLLRKHREQIKTGEIFLLKCECLRTDSQRFPRLTIREMTPISEASGTTATTPRSARRSAPRSALASPASDPSGSEDTTREPMTDTGKTATHTTKQTTVSEAHTSETSRKTNANMQDVPHTLQVTILHRSGLEGLHGILQKTPKGPVRLQLLLVREGADRPFCSVVPSSGYMMSAAVLAQMETLKGVKLGDKKS